MGRGMVVLLLRGGWILLERRGYKGEGPATYWAGAEEGMILRVTRKRSSMGSVWGGGR